MVVSAGHESPTNLRCWHLFYTYRRVFRRHSPTQHALFLKHASSLTIEFKDDASVQTNFDQLYTVMRALIDRFYPEREITMTSSDPHFVIPAVKSMLRRKTRLMRAGRTAEADSLACRVHKIITHQSSKWLRDIDTKKSPAAAWKKVREVIHGPRRDNNQPVCGITAQILNDQYRAPELIRRPTSSRLVTCTPSRPATDYSSFPTTRTWSFPRSTQTHARWRLVISGHGRRRII